MLRSNRTAHFCRQKPPPIHQFHKKLMALGRPQPTSIISDIQYLHHNTYLQHINLSQHITQHLHLTHHLHHSLPTPQHITYIEGLKIYDQCHQHEQPTTLPHVTLKKLTSRSVKRRRSLSPRQMTSKRMANVKVRSTITQ